MEGALVGGVPGTSSNIPSGTATMALPPPETHQKPVVVNSDEELTDIQKPKANTYAVSKTVRHTLNPAGRLRRISAALLVDDMTETKVVNGKETHTRRKRTADELKDIENLAKASIGIDAQRGDTLTVENLSFEQTPRRAGDQTSDGGSRQIILRDWSSIVRYASLLLLFLLAYFLFLRPLKKQVLATVRELPARVATQHSGLAGPAWKCSRGSAS